MIDAVAVRGLTFAYPGAPGPTVDDVTLTVGAGEVVGFLGPSGAGKTTTLKILTGQLSGWSGEVEILGRSLRDWDRGLYDRIGVSFELPVGLPTLTAREDLALFAALHHSETASADELLSTLGLATAADTRLETFSKGMRTRLNLARSLLHRPDVLFLDEPTGGLDPSTADQVHRVIEMARDRGAAILLATHDMATAEATCDRVAFFGRGTILALDSPARLSAGMTDRRVRVEHRRGDELVTDTMSLDEADRLARLMSSGAVTRIHSLEPDLGEIFRRLDRR